jgi:hypothetical protein
LYALPAGTYNLTALFASDQGNTITFSAYGNSEEFIMENSKSLGQDGRISFTLTEETDVVIKVSSPKWFKADNFRLTYVNSVITPGDTPTSEVVYQSDFNNEMTDGIPTGWIVYNEAGFHIYGFNDDGLQKNYGWGGTPGGGGARLYAGFSGDFSKALYWGTRGTNEGYASYGEQARDWILEDGTLDPAAPEGISLYLTPQNYQIFFQMAAWKGEPHFSFTLEDLDGNVYAEFSDFVAKPDMNGATGTVSGTEMYNAAFSVADTGYYVLKFTSAEAQWQEFLLSNVRLVTMPSNDSYYRLLLSEAIEEAEAVLASAEDSSYDGDTKTALVNEIDNAKNGNFTSDSEVNAVIDNLKELCNAMTKRMENIDNFEVAMLEAIAAYDELDGKYLNAEIATTSKSVIDQYGSTNASALSDDELNEITPAIMKAATQMKNVKSVVDVLAWGAFKAAQTATLLGEDGTAGYEAVTDDRTVVQNLNYASTLALYNKIAAGEDLTPYMTSVYYETGDQLEEIPADNNGEYNEDGFPRAIFGIDFTGLIHNPHMYTFMTASTAIQDNSIPGWMCTQTTTYGKLSFTGDPASEEKPASDVTVNNWKGIYDYYQVVENIPVGYYDIMLRTRTYPGMNGQNSDGVWDKYMYVQVGDGERIMVPFEEGVSWDGYPTVIKHVLVKDGKIRIGAVEDILSPTAIENNGWGTSTFIDDARIFFVAPTDDIDYSKLGRVTLGDVNGDGRINGLDIVEMVDKILDRPSETFIFDAGDFDGNGVINGMDLVEEVALVLSQTSSGVKIRKAPERLNPDMASIMRMSKNNDGGISVGVESADDYILSQFMIELSDGQQLRDITSTDRDHVVAWQPIDEIRYMVVCYSTRNTAFADNNDLLRISCEGSGTVRVSDVMLVDTDRKPHYINGSEFDIATGIELVNGSFAKPADIYSVSGVLVKKNANSTKGLGKGIYVVDGKTILIK